MNHKLLLVLVFTALLAAAVSIQPKTEIELQKHQLRLKKALSSLFPFKLSSKSLSVNGDNGTECVVCVILLGIVENYVKYKESDIEKALTQSCELLPKEIITPCHLIVSLFGKKIIELIEQKQRPDVICQEITFCKNKQCKLFTSTQQNYKVSQESDEEIMKKLQLVEQQSNEWWKEIFERIYNVFDKHLPAYDFDNDRHATSYTLRGGAWRGRDCDDNKSDVYPGRKSSSYPNDVDHNCNGIYGTAENGMSYESLYCNVTQRGVIVLGDSACAHFRIPEQFVLPQYLNKTTFQPILQVAENEADWPHLSAYTGHVTQDTTKLTPGPIDSIYLRMFERNRCIHRDYQNICVNGARTGDTQTTAKTLNRNGKYDHPAIVFYALVGNDVCHPHPNFDYTTPEEFYAHVTNTLDFLESVLPPDSYVVMIGLAPGEILYNTLWNRTHPIGVTYQKVYDFMNCLEINPCWGWMNSNATVRQITTEHSRKLTAVYSKIIQDKKGVYKNLQLIYHDFVFDKILEEYKQKGGDIADLIEPMDGFHPSQITNSLFAKYLWEDLEAGYPGIFGPVNPNNAKIQQRFGDQGGF